MFDLEHGDKAREPLRQQMDPASTRNAPPLGIMHRDSPIQQARRELQSVQDRDCRKSAFSLRAKHLSRDTWRDTLAMTSGDRIFHDAFRSAKEPLSIGVTCPIAFAGVNDRRVPVVQLREQARGLPMNRSSN